MKVLNSILVCLLLAGCSGKNGSDQKSQETKSETPVQESKDETVVETKEVRYQISRKVVFEDDFSNVEEFKENINRHRISAFAKEGSFHNSYLKCQKSFFDRNNSISIQKFDRFGQEASVEIELLPTDPAGVSIECFVSTDDDVTKPVKFEIKKSYIVNGKINYQSEIGSEIVGTLFIDEDGVLVSNGEPLQIKMDELISNKGKVTTFTEEEVDSSRENTNGASGGSIVLDAITAHGDLIVELRGKNGGVRSTIPDPVKNAPPFDPSLNGKCTIPHPDHGGNSCHGRPGKKGNKGTIGNPGLKGGDSGSLSLSVLKENSLNVDVLYFPGKGSAGSIGGRGGPGGKGGIGDTLVWFDQPDTHGNAGCARCSMSEVNGRKTKKYPDGPNGPEGDIGETGERGADGGPEKSSIQLGIHSKHIIEANWKNY